jgi:hypothetical protein
MIQVDLGGWSVDLGDQSDLGGPRWMFWVGDLDGWVVLSRRGRWKKRRFGEWSYATGREGGVQRFNPWELSLSKQSE